MRCFDLDARTDVRRDERVIEDGDLRQRAGPCAVLKNIRCAVGGDDNMGLVHRAEALPLIDQRCLARAERAQDRRERRLASPVLAIDEGEAGKRELRADVYIVELADIPQKLKTLDHDGPLNPM